MEHDGGLLQKIESLLRKTGFDERLTNACLFHLRKYKEHEKITSRQDLCEMFMTKLFIDKMDDIFLIKSFESQVTEESDWPVKLIPVDCFGHTQLPANYRRDCFYKCLKISDVLDCRVATVNPFDYHLRVIHKYGVAGLFEDLNIMVILPDTDALYLEKELLPCEVVRVKVTRIVETEANDIIYVTIKEDNCEMQKIRKLGRLSEFFLPSYVLNPLDAKKFSSYSKYLNCMPQFSNPTLLNDIYTGFGIDLGSVYSFFPDFNGSKCDESQTGQALLKGSKTCIAIKYASLASEACAEKKFSESLEYINKAIQVCPDKDELHNLYNIRGTIHSTSKQSKLCEETLSDWIRAYALQSNDETVKNYLSKYLFKLANKFYRKKEYKKAVLMAEKSLEFNENNVESRSLIDYFKKKHSEIIFDKESLTTLQEKQMELVSKLRNIK